MIRRALLGGIGLLALAGCGGDAAEPPPALDAVSPAPAASPPPGALAEPETLDSAAVARAIAEDSALEAENRATYETRLRSMGGYAECMAQTRDLPPETRARVQAACERRRAAP